ncbi:MAG TPA: hypothetical protein VFH73_08240, partial [Polyangia bacterium]|nr:hypothetical protein [Polyangia bacterium]
MCVLLTLACNGQIGPPGAPPGPTTGGGTGMVPKTDNTPKECVDITDVDATPLRRLTNADYINSVTDLLGDVSAVTMDFTPELTTE